MTRLALPRLGGPLLDKWSRAARQTPRPGASQAWNIRAGTSAGALRVLVAGRHPAQPSTAARPAPRAPATVATDLAPHPGLCQARVRISRACGEWRAASGGRIPPLPGLPRARSVRRRPAPAAPLRSGGRAWCGEGRGGRGGQGAGRERKRGGVTRAPGPLLHLRSRSHRPPSTPPPPGAWPCSAARDLLFYSTLLCSVLFYSVLFCSILFCPILLYSVLFCSILLYSIPFHSIPFHSIPFCSVLFYSYLFYPILFFNTSTARPGLLGCPGADLLGPGGGGGGGGTLQQSEASAWPCLCPAVVTQCVHSVSPTLCTPCPVWPRGSRWLSGLMPWT